MKPRINKDYTSLEADIPLSQLSYQEFDEFPIHPYTYLEAALEVRPNAELKKDAYGVAHLFSLLL